MTVFLNSKARIKKQSNPSPLHQRLKRSLLVMAPSALAGAFGIMPATAFVSEMFDDNIWEIIESVVINNVGVDQWFDILNSILNDPCQDFPSTGPFVPTEGPWCQSNGGSGGNDGNILVINDVVKDSQGEMGIPNPNSVRGKINAGAVTFEPADIPDAFEINKVVWGTYAGNSFDRDLTRLGIETVLGELGQQQMKQEIDSTQETVSGIATDAESAQNLDVTQDVMKKHIRVLAQQSLILGAIRADALQARLDTQYTNLNITNISRSLDESNRSRRVEQSAQAAKLLFIASQAHLY